MNTIPPEFLIEMDTIPNEGAQSYDSCRDSIKDTSTDQNPTNIIISSSGRNNETHDEWGRLIIVSINHKITEKLNQKGGPLPIGLSFALIGDNLTLGKESVEKSRERLKGKQPIQFPLISPQQFSIERDGHKIYIRDNNSTNGTLLNGLRIDRSVLLHNDLIIIKTGAATTLLHNEYINAEKQTRDGLVVERRNDYATEQEWKAALLDGLTESIIFRLRITDPSMQESHISSSRHLTPMNNTIDCIGHIVTESSYRAQLSHENVLVQNSGDIAPLTGKRKDRQSSSGRDKKKNKQTPKETNVGNDVLVSLCERELRCSVCVNLFFEPMTLQCGHTFCYECVINTFRSCKKDCPLCKHPITTQPCKAIGIENFTNLYLSSVKQEEREEFEQRADSITLGRAERSAQLKQSIQNLMNQPESESPFPMVTSLWTSAERCDFRQELSLHFGKDRKKCLKLVGLNRQSILNYDSAELIMACENLGVPIIYPLYDIKIAYNTRRDPDLDSTRRVLSAFLSDAFNLLYQ